MLGTQALSPMKILLALLASLAPAGTRYNLALSPIAIHVRLVGQAVTHSVDMGAVGAGFLRGLGPLAFGPTQHAVVCWPGAVDVAGAHLQLPSHHLYCCSSPAQQE